MSELTVDRTSLVRAPQQRTSPLPVADSWWLLVAQRAQLTPDAPMLHDGWGRTVTFGQFRMLAEQVAEALGEVGVTRGTRVSWQLPTSLEAVALVAALAHVGAVQNPLLPTLDRTQVDAVGNRFGPQMFIAVRSWRGYDYTGTAACLAARHDSTVWLCEIDGRGFGLPRCDRGQRRPPAPPAGPSASRWVFFSPGADGTPQALQHSDRSLQATSDALTDSRLQLSTGALQPMTFPVASPAGPAVLACQLRTGHRMMLANDDGHPGDPLPKSAAST